MFVVVFLLLLMCFYFVRCCLCSVVCLGFVGCLGLLVGALGLAFYKANILTAITLGRRAVSLTKLAFT